MPRGLRRSRKFWPSFLATFGRVIFLFERRRRNCTRMLAHPSLPFRQNWRISRLRRPPIISKLRLLLPPRPLLRLLALPFPCRVLISLPIQRRALLLPRHQPSSTRKIRTPLFPERALKPHKCRPSRPRVSLSPNFWVN